VFDSGVMQIHQAGGAEDFAAGRDFSPTTSYRNCESSAYWLIGGGKLWRPHDICVWPAAI